MTRLDLLDLFHRCGALLEGACPRLVRTPRAKASSCEARFEACSRLNGLFITKSRSTRRRTKKNRPQSHRENTEARLRFDGSACLAGRRPQADRVDARTPGCPSWFARRPDSACARRCATPIEPVPRSDSAQSQSSASKALGESFSPWLCDSVARPRFVTLRDLRVFVMHRRSNNPHAHV